MAAKALPKAVEKIVAAKIAPKALDPPSATSSCRRGLAPGAMDAISPTFLQPKQLAKE